MKILKFNEGVKNLKVRDLMKGKSEEEILKKLNNLTPYGMLNKVMSNDLGEKYEELVNKRIDEAEKKLDNILKKEDIELLDILQEVTNWVEENGGNSVNVENFIFPLGEQIYEYGFQHRHDSIVIYDEDVFESFKKLLKNFAICEVSNNNSDNGDY